MSRRRAISQRQSPPDSAELGAQVSENDTPAPRTVELLGGWRLSIAIDATIDERIEAIASRQRARLSRAQAVAVEVSGAALCRRVAAGRLVREHHGVYAVAPVIEIPLADETSALLACGLRAMLSDHSAATTWEMRPGRARPIHILLPGSARGPAPDGVIVHRSAILRRADVRIHEGLPITSPARTLLDISAGDLRERDVQLALEEGVYRKIVTIVELRTLLRRAGGHPGRPLLTRVVSMFTGTTRTESRPEEDAFALIDRAGLPQPQTGQYRLGYRLDLYWPEARLVVEIDGPAHNLPSRRRSDARRDARLFTELQIVTLRFTPEEVSEQPFAVISTISRAYALGVATMSREVDFRSDRSSY